MHPSTLLKLEVLCAIPLSGLWLLFLGENSLGFDASDGKPTWYWAGGIGLSALWICLLCTSFRSVPLIVRLALAAGLTCGIGLAALLLGSSLGAGAPAFVLLAGALIGCMLLAGCHQLARVLAPGRFDPVPRQKVRRVVPASAAGPPPRSRSG